MKRFEAKVIQQVSLPWNARIVLHPHDEIECILIDGRYFLPALVWSEFKEDATPSSAKSKPGRGSWVEGDDAIEELYFLSDKADVVDECQIREFRESEIAAARLADEGDFPSDSQTPK